MSNQSKTPEHHHHNMTKQLSYILGIKHSYNIYIQTITHIQYIATAHNPDK